MPFLSPIVAHWRDKSSEIILTVYVLINQGIIAQYIFTWDTVFAVRLPFVPLHFAWNLLFFVSGRFHSKADHVYNKISLYYFLWIGAGRLTRSENSPNPAGYLRLEHNDSRFEAIRFDSNHESIVKKSAFRFTITGFCIMNNVFRSTSKSRPNNIRGGECPSVRPSVRPQKVSSISMKFGM